MAGGTERKILSRILYIVLIVLFFGAGWFSREFLHVGHSGRVEQIGVVWTCPMHPQIISDKPGECSICFMSLVKKETSPKPTANKTQTQERQGVYINARKQQLIGVKKEIIRERELTVRIDTVGKVAYLPNLYVTQQEYLQAVRYRQITQKADPNIYSQSARQDIADAARTKLLSLGMNESQISRMEQTGKPETSLYLPENEKVWISITLYEQDAGYVKEGLAVEVEPIAYPGTIVKGVIVSIAPILDAMTRTLQVRALVDNPGNLLKMEMSVNVRIQFPIGKKLAVPQDAVMRTGTKSIVYVINEDGYFTSHEVELGAKSQGYYEAIKGLQAGQTVVASGNFLIDSESQLNAALNRTSESGDKPAAP